MPHRTLTRVILVRHGESVVSVQQVLGGMESCSGLSALGRRQTEALRDRWRHGGEPVVDALYSSAMPRALQTAEILNESLGGLPIQIDEDLEELRPGEADGIRFDELEAHYGHIDLRSRPDRPMTPTTETSMGFHHRAARALERVLAANVAKTVLVACHGGVVDVAFRHFLDLSRRGNFDLYTVNTSLTEFHVDDTGQERGRWRLKRYNDHAHLVGLPSRTQRTQSG